MKTQLLILLSFFVSFRAKADICSQTVNLAIQSCRPPSNADQQKIGSSFEAADDSGSMLKATDQQIATTEAIANVAQTAAQNCGAAIELCQKKCASSARQFKFCNDDLMQQQSALQSSANAATMSASATRATASTLTGQSQVADERFGNYGRPVFEDKDGRFTAGQAGPNGRVSAVREIINMYPGSRCVANCQ